MREIPLQTEAMPSPPLKIHACRLGHSCQKKTKVSNPVRFLNLHVLSHDLPLYPVDCSDVRAMNLHHMCPHVPSEVAEVGERLAVSLADMRFLPRM